MRNRMWELSSVVTGPLEILMAEGVITEHSTGSFAFGNMRLDMGEEKLKRRDRKYREPKKGQDISGDSHRDLRPTFDLL